MRQGLTTNSRVTGRFAFLGRGSERAILNLVQWTLYCPGMNSERPGMWSVGGAACALAVRVRVVGRDAALNLLSLPCRCPRGEPPSCLFARTTDRVRPHEQKCAPPPPLPYLAGICNSFFPSVSRITAPSRVQLSRCCQLRLGLDARRVKRHDCDCVILQVCWTCANAV
jgi:hypothetical protein